MTQTEIKKALYKEKPKAFFNGITEDSVHEYQAWLENGNLITFKVPRSEMGETPFKDVEDAQLLIRWL